MEQFIRAAMSAGIVTDSIAQARRMIDAPPPAAVCPPVPTDLIDELGAAAVAGRLTREEVGSRLAAADALAGRTADALRTRVAQLRDAAVIALLQGDAKRIGKLVTGEYATARKAYDSAVDALARAGVPLPYREPGTVWMRKAPSFAEELRMRAASVGSAALAAHEHWSACKVRLDAVAKCYTCAISAGLVAAPADARRTEIKVQDGSFVAV